MREPRILISRRYSDSSIYGQRLYGKLRARFDEERILGKPEPSNPQVVREMVESCDVLIALVGRHFLYDRDGQSNLADKFDYVRLSIATALDCGVHVIPVLLPGCRMPHAEDLPEDLQRFASLRAIEFDFFTWKDNSDILISIIEKLPPKSAPADRTQIPTAMPISAEILIERAKGIRQGRKLFGHADFPACMAFSPDGRLLASGSYDQTVRLWNVETGRLLWTREDHWPIALSVAFSPDGRTLACTGEQRESRAYSSEYGVWLCDVETGRTLRRLTGHASYVNCVAFSPDGRMLASASNDRTVKLWDLEDDPDRTELSSSTYTLLGHTEAVWSLSFSPDGHLLASASRDGTVRLWHFPSRTESRILKQTARTVAFSPDGRLLALDLMKSFPPPGIVKTSLLLTETGTGRALREVTPVSNLLALAWTPDASIVALRLEDSLQLLHAESGRAVYAQPMPGGAKGRGYVRPLGVSPDGRLLATFIGGSTHELQLWDISALDVGPKAQREKPRAAVTTPLNAHLRTLPLSHGAPPTPARPAAWLRSAAATGVRPPLCVVQDFGALLTQPRAQLRLERPDHLAAGIDTSSYLNLLTRLAAHPLLREVSTWDISDSVAGVVIARLVAGLSFPEIYSVPGGVEAVAFTQRLSRELSKADPGRIWRETEVAERPSLNQLFPPEAVAQIESNLRRLDGDELRFLHRYGVRFTGAPEPQEMLDLFNLLDLPPAVRLSLSQVLRLLPRVSQAVSKGGGMQTYAMGGYAGLTHRGSLDSLVPTELAYPSQMLLHRLLNQEALYYGRESEPQRQREVTYIVTQAGLDVRGDVDVLARAVTLALVQAMQGRGYEVQQSFVGSRWTEPALMSRPSDVQRVLYYQDEGALSAREMLSSVLGQLRSWRERYRGLHLIWVVGEHWDADEREENRDLYTALKASANQQAWFIRLGGEGVKARGEEPLAGRDFGRYQIVNSRIMWEKQEPPVVMYVPPVEAPTETVTEGPWVEPVMPPRRVMLIHAYHGSYGAQVRDLITEELRARKHMVMIDGSLTDHEAWMSALSGVHLVVPLISAAVADSSVIHAGIDAARVHGRRAGGPRLLPVLVTDTMPLHDPDYEEMLTRGSLNGILDPSDCFTWRGKEDNQALLRAMIEALAPAPSPLRLDGLYYQPFSHPTQSRDWFRFYADGTVVSITTTEGTPEQAARWMSEELRDGNARVGRYETNGARVAMSFPEKPYPSNGWSYVGRIGDNSLRLDGTHNGTPLLQTDYQFAAIPDFSVAAQDSSVASPLRFDGVYATGIECMDWTHPEKDWSWMATCLKFMPDGRVYPTMVWRLDDAGDYVPGRDAQPGHYEIDGNSLELVLANSRGETMHCRGTIQGDVITVSGAPYDGHYSFIAPRSPVPPIAVRFDGVYTNTYLWMDSVHPDRAGWNRLTFKFNSDGTVSYTASGLWGDEVPEVRRPGEDDPQGTYQVNGSVIQIEIRFSDGETRNWHGTIENETITISLEAGLRQYSFNNDPKQFTFVSDQDIPA